MRNVRTDPAALRRTRERAGHTMRSLALASGVTHFTISRGEAESVPIRPTTAKAIADALGADIEDITLDDDPAEVAS